MSWASLCGSRRGQQRSACRHVLQKHCDSAAAPAVVVLGVRATAKRETCFRDRRLDVPARADPKVNQAILGLTGDGSRKDVGSRLIKAALIRCWSGRVLYFGAQPPPHVKNQDAQRLYPSRISISWRAPYRLSRCDFQASRWAMTRTFLTLARSDVGRAFSTAATAPRADRIRPKRLKEDKMPAHVACSNTCSSSISWQWDLISSPS